MQFGSPTSNKMNFIAIAKLAKGDKEKEKMIREN